MTEQTAEIALTWRDYCKHYGSCQIGSNGKCFTPEDPVYVEAMERRYSPGQEAGA